MYFAQRAQRGNSTVQFHMLLFEFSFCLWPLTTCCCFCVCAIFFLKQILNFVLVCDCVKFEFSFGKELMSLCRLQCHRKNFVVPFVNCRIDTVCYLWVGRFVSMARLWTLSQCLLNVFRSRLCEGHAEAELRLMAIWLTGILASRTPLGNTKLWWETGL